jgi:hypothetical protein
MIPFSDFLKTSDQKKTVSSPVVTPQVTTSNVASAPTAQPKSFFQQISDFRANKQPNSIIKGIFNKKVLTETIPTAISSLGNTLKDWATTTGSVLAGSNRQEEEQILQNKKIEDSIKANRQQIALKYIKEGKPEMAKEILARPTGTSQEQYETFAKKTQEQAQKYKKDAINTAMITASAGTKLNLPGIGLSGLVSGGMASLNGEDPYKAAGEGMANAIRWKAVTQFTDPTIGKFINTLVDPKLSPVIKQLTSRVVSGIGNIYEDRIIAKLDGYKPGLKDDISSFIIGAIMSNGGKGQGSFKDVNLTSVKSAIAKDINNTFKLDAKDKVLVSKALNSIESTIKKTILNPDGTLKTKPGFINLGVGPNVEKLSKISQEDRDIIGKFAAVIDEGKTRNNLGQLGLDVQRIAEGLGLDTNVSNKELVKQFNDTLQKMDELEIKPQVPVEKGPTIEPFMKERGVITSVKESPDVSAKVKETVSGEYPPVHNQETMIKAQKAVSEDLAGAVRRVMDDNTFDADTSAQAIVIAKQFDAEGRIGEADAIWEKIAEKATKAGQGNQALIMLGQQSTQGMQKMAKRIIDQANESRNGIINKLFGVKKVEFSEELQNKIKSMMTEARQLPDGEAKNLKIKQVLEEIGSRIPPTASELVDAYRYNNMLSSPNTWGPTGRNTWYNIGQTFITKPTTMAFQVLNDVVLSTLQGKERQHYLKDIPLYYKTVFNMIPQAAQGSLSVFTGAKGNLNPDVSNITSKGMLDLVRESRQKKLPKALTTFSNLMEMNDRFFSSLISSGEYAVKKANGVDDKTAKESADKIAEYWLGRSRPDPTNKTGQGALLSSIDKFESWLISGRSNAPVKWMIPFINMATQVAKQTLEFSPVGLATLKGSTRKSEQLAKVTAGVSAMLISSLLVQSNNVTLDAPKNEDERKEFYASGRKPYSIKIGKTWVPINIFGPLSLAIGSVAAWKYQHDQAPDKFTTNEYQKITKVIGNQFSRFAQQPMLQGLSNLAKLMSGDIDYTVPSTLAFTAGQTIPLNGMLRYISTIYDPIFRSVKGEGFTGSIKKDLPVFSKQLLPYLEPEGEPSKRNVTDYLAPYSMGFSNPKYEELYQQTQQINQIEGVSKAAKSEINAINKRIENISLDTSLSDEERSKKLDQEALKLEKAAAKMDVNFQKMGPMIEPK